MRASAFALLLALSMPALSQDSSAKPAPRVSGGVMAGQLLTSVPPKYPRKAREASISGAVVMRAIINRDGFVANVTVVSGPAILRDAATDAVKQWTYKPYLLNGQPTEVDTTITVNFDLNSAPPPPAAQPPASSAGNAAASLPPPPVGRVRISSGVLAAMRMDGATPDLCGLSRVSGVNGAVVLHVVVRNDGSVDSADALSGPEELRQAAVEAVQRWTYRPYLLNGNPVEVDSTVTIEPNCGS